MTADTIAHARPVAGFLGFAFGALALVLVLVHFWAGPFAPQQRAGVTIGEIAGDIRKAAVRKLKGEPQPKAVPAEWDTDRVLKLVVAVLAGLAVVTSVAGLVRREAWRPAAAGIAFGVSAVTFQIFTWTILVLAGAIILYAIINNIGEILGG